MKITRVLFGFVLTTLMATGVNVALAAPFNSNNPNIVANYSNGNHGIPGDFTRYTGLDVVKRSGNSSNFQQWFYGWSEALNATVGKHSVWNISKGGTCPNNAWVLVPNASENWGSYLVHGADYCVKTNN